MTDIRDALVWYLTLQALGAIALPWAFEVFRFLPGRGVTLVKPLALLVIGYALWLLGVARLLPNTRLTILALVLAGAGFSGWLAWRRREELFRFLTREWRLLALAEVIFLAMFAGWAFVASGAPDITPGFEKPMNFGILNALVQSRSFPPEDMWLSGHSLVYYYFGHLITALLTQLTGISTAISFNLAAATAPALAGAAICGLLHDLARLARRRRRSALLAGGLAPVIVLLCGNLQGILEFLLYRGWGGDRFWEWINLEWHTLEWHTSETNVPWWWRAARVVSTRLPDEPTEHTINEFPAWSFVGGDHHAHMVALPWLLFALAATLCALRAPGRLGWSWWKAHPLLAAALALAVGSVGFLNPWAYPVVAALAGAALLLKAYRDEAGHLRRAARRWLEVALPLVALSWFLFVPWWTQSIEAPLAIRPLVEPGLRTRPLSLFLAFGPFLFITLAWLFRRRTSLRRLGLDHRPAAMLVMAVAALPFLVWLGWGFAPAALGDAGAAVALGDLVQRAALVVPGTAVVAVAGLLALTYARRRAGLAHAFGFLLVALGCYLLVGAELFFVEDWWDHGATQRKDTVFKLHYTGWLLLGTAAAFGLPELRSRTIPRPRRSPRTAPARLALPTVAATLLAIGLAWTAVAAASRSGVLREAVPGEDESPRRTLDGLDFLRQCCPDEHAAILWLRESAEYGRLVETVVEGNSELLGLTAYLTGYPTVLGWVLQEATWRGPGPILDERYRDVHIIFAGTLPFDVRGLMDNLLRKYGVRYIWFGPVEHLVYGAAAQERLDSFPFLEAVFANDGVTVYQVSLPESSVPASAPQGP